MKANRPRDLEPDESTFLSQFDDELRAMTARFADCPAPDLLRAADADALPPPVAAALRRHIEACPLCLSLAQDLRELQDAGLGDERRRRIRTRVLGASVRVGRWSAVHNWWAGIAAGAAAAAAAVWLGVSQPGTLAVPVADAPARLMPPAVARPSILTPDSAAVALPLTAVLTMRGERSSSLDLQAGLALYHRGDYSGAAEHLARIVPDASLPQLAVYLAVSYLHIGDPAAAERTLASARGLSGDAAGEAEWFRALTLARLGESARARVEFDRLCQGSGARALQACAATFELDR